MWAWAMILQGPRNGSTRLWHLRCYRRCSSRWMALFFQLKNRGTTLVEGGLLLLCSVKSFGIAALK